MFNQSNPDHVTSTPTSSKYDITNSPYFVDPKNYNFEANILKRTWENEKGSSFKYRKKSEIQEKSPTKLRVIQNKKGIISPRKKVDRFDGIPEEEVAKKFLPDHIDHNLDILIIGINPGLYAAHKGHHYAGPGNHFWKCLFMSGLTPEQFSAYDDFRMPQFGIGFTNVVARTTRGSADLSRSEIEQGSKILLTKLQHFRPKIAVFNGKGIYEVFSRKKDFPFGKQPDLIHGTDTHVWVMPSSSARCAQLPRAVDKLRFYEALRKFRDFLNGRLAYLSEDEIVFRNLKLKSYAKERNGEVQKTDSAQNCFEIAESSPKEFSEKAMSEPQKPDFSFVSDKPKSYFSVITPGCDTRETEFSEEANPVSERVLKSEFDKDNFHNVSVKCEPRERFM